MESVGVRFTADLEDAVDDVTGVEGVEMGRGEKGRREGSADGASGRLVWGGGAGVE